MQPAEGHTGSTSAESQEPPAGRGVITPTSQLEMEVQGEAQPPKTPSYHKAAPGFGLSCPVCRPHMLSGLCHAPSLRGPDSGRRARPRLHGSLTLRQVRGHHVWP